MLKLTLFTTDQACKELGEVEIAHMTIFEPNSMELHCISDESQLKLMKILIKQYVTFSCTGSKVSVDMKQYHRIRFRFDSKRV